MSGKQPAWPEDIFKALVDLDVVQVGYVPDLGHNQIIRMCHEDARIHPVLLTHEQEGIGLVSGAWLGGQRSALLMQSSGVGNIVNMLSMTQSCRFPLLLIATMRGEWGETNPWQNPMGQTTAETLKLQGVIVYTATTAEEVGEAVRAAGSIAFNGQTAAAVLISQRVLGIKQFKD